MRCYCEWQLANTNHFVVVQFGRLIGLARLQAKIVCLQRKTIQGRSNAELGMSWRWRSCKLSSAGAIITHNDFQQSASKQVNFCWPQNRLLGTVTNTKPFPAPGENDFRVRGGLELVVGDNVSWSFFRMTWCLFSFESEQFVSVNLKVLEVPVSWMFLAMSNGWSMTSKANKELNFS